MSPQPRTLRPYQSEAVQAVFNEWGNETRRTAVVLPTGTGKSTVIGTIAAESARMGLPVVLLAHRGELLDQMASTVAVCAPDLPPVGIVRADEDNPHAQIVAASFQTLVNDRRHASLGERKVVLVDETHHITAPSFSAVVNGFGNDIFMCGFTATLRREDSKPLRSMIESVAFERNLRWAIAPEQGYLVMPKGITVKIPALDLNKVKTTAGDFQNNDLAEVMESETPEVVKAILKHLSDRRPIVFAASVQAAHDIAAQMTAGGMVAEAVTGSMAYEQRQPIYEAYRNGHVQALVTVMVLTEGADFPMCDAVAIARPTQSQNLYSQMVGRALRLWPGKTDAVVLDLVGTSRVLKLVTIANLDAGVVPKVVDTEGEEYLPEDDEAISMEAILPTAKQRRQGPIDTIGIDLLGPEETGILWLGTVKGVPFVAPQESGMAWFLWDVGNDHYRVGFMAVKGGKAGGWLDGGRGYPLDVAVAAAEDDIIEKGYAFPLRAASWRKYQPPSDAQVKYARGLGIINPEEMTKARLSDEISIALMSARLDGAR